MSSLRYSLVLLIGVILLIISFTQSKYPKIELSEPIIDFGTLRLGDRKQISLEVKNCGNSNLIISKIVASCGCVSVSMKERLIPPSQKGIITIDLTSISGKGKVKLDMFIFSNDPKSPSFPVSLVYHAEINSPLERNQINFGRIDHSELPIIRRIFFSENTRSDLKSHAENLLPYLSMNYPVSQNDNGFFVEMVLHDNAPSGDLHSEAVVHYGDESFTIYVIGHIRSKLIAVPSSLVLNVEKRIATVNIQSRDTVTPIDFTDVKLEIDYIVNGKKDFSANIVGRDQNNVTVEVAYIGDELGTRVSIILGTLILYFCDNGNECSIAVPVLYRSY